MPARDTLENAAFDNFVGNFTSGPLADGALGALGDFAGQSHDLADLFGADADRPAWTRQVRQSLCQAQVFSQTAQTEPALAPVSRHGHADVQRARDVFIRRSIARS